MKTATFKNHIKATHTLHRLAYFVSKMFYKTQCRAA